MSGSKYIQIGPNSDKYAEYVVLMDPVTGLPTNPGGGNAPLDPRLDNLADIETFTSATATWLSQIHNNFGGLIDQSIKIETIRFYTEQIFQYLQGTIPIPVTSVNRKAHPCSAYDLENAASFQIPANPQRKSLRIINASGNGEVFPTANQSDLLVGVTVVPNGETFDRHIGPLGSELMDFPQLEHYVGAIGQTSLDGFFIIVEGF